MPDVNYLLNRVAFGARPSDLQRVPDIGIDKFLETQLHPERIEDKFTESKLDAVPSIRMTTAQLLEKFPRPAQARQPRRNQAEMRRVNIPQQILQELQGQKIIRAVHSERQLQEVMTEFWFNHFNVFWGKNADRWLTTEYEMSAIRPHVLGKFKDLLMATAKNPAMLFYLDNHLSSSIKGINENYARELMELHTLGVDGGYTQKDVQEVSRALTGWAIHMTQVTVQSMV